MDRAINANDRLCLIWALVVAPGVADASLPREPSRRVEIAHK